MITSLIAKDSTRKFLVAIGLCLLAIVLLATRGRTHGQVVGILQQIGIYSPPAWLVWAILAAGTISLIVAAIAMFNPLIVVPLWAQYAMLGAGTYGI